MQQAPTKRYISKNNNNRSICKCLMFSSFRKILDLWPWRFTFRPISKKVPPVRSKLTASDPGQSCNVLLTPHVHPRVGLRCIFCILCLFRMVGGGELDFFRTRWRLQPRLLLLLSGVGLGVQHGVGPRVLLHCVLIKVLDGVDGGVGVRFHHGGWGAASTWPWPRTCRT